MTKYDILEAVALDFFSLEQILDEFFDSNVCIPKGLQPHPYADVLHAWLEGADIQQQFNETNVWYDRKETAIKQFVFTRYRIKPSEPIYEWQWMINNQVEFIEYKTEDEISEYFNGTDDFDRIIKTQRERK